MTDHHIPDDDTLKSRVRDLTLYDDDPDELPSAELDGQVNVAKLRLENKTGSTDWYDGSSMLDGGLAQALLGVTCILAKAAVENYSVSSWSIGDQTIDVQGAGNADQVQFQQWNDNLVLEGLQAADVSDDTVRAPTNSTDYIG